MKTPTSHYDPTHPFDDELEQDASINGAAHNPTSFGGIAPRTRPERTSIKPEAVIHNPHRPANER